MSVVDAEGVIYPEKMENGRTKKNGLMDPRQGPGDWSNLCHTCFADIGKCPGHFGHIELAKPVFHMGFKEKTVKMLRCVCFNCKRLLANPDSDEVRHIVNNYKNGARFDKMYIITQKIKTCLTFGEADAQDDGQGKLQQQFREGCNKIQPKISRNGLDLFVEDKAENEAKKPLSAEVVHDIFKGISEEDMVVLGFNPQFSRPESLVLTVLAVPPMTVRPCVVMGISGNSHDDLTHKLTEIVKVNNDIREAEKQGVSSAILSQKQMLLQYHVATYMDNDSPALPTATQKSGRPLRSLKARLKGKQGRIRSNLMGKRVDYCARTVITADPNLNLDQVGVPQMIAQNLTFDEKVTPFNLRFLQSLVNNGSTYPGADFVIKENGERIDLKRRPDTKDVRIQYGWTVSRHMINDDIVVFNRQPTLHKMSMMGHRVKVLPFSTFRLNLSVTSPYNADFDGDEMNLHLPQSQAVRAEIKQLALVKNLFITPQSNKPVMSIVQDTLTGCYKMTARDVFLTKEQMMHLLMFLDGWDGKMPRPAVYKPVQYWTGKQLFSMIIPGKLNCSTLQMQHSDSENNTPNHWMSPRDTRVIIQNSQLVCGILCKKTLGTGSNSLIHVMALEKKPDEVAMFFNNCQTVVNNWLMYSAHSIGISDCLHDSETRSRIKTIIKHAKEEVYQTIDKAHNYELECLPGKKMQETFQATINNTLNMAVGSTGKEAQNSLNKYNNLLIMASSGAKGSKINIAQIIACVGQQNVEGKRIPRGYFDRTLPHFLKDDEGPEARGFVENSYLNGLTPSEFFFHAMGGREGLIDTAVKTAETGYIQRRLVKAMESVKVEPDGTVRNQTGQVLQFVYGGDGLDGAHVERQKLPTFWLNDEQMKQSFHFNLMHMSAGLEELVSFMDEDAVSELRKRRTEAMLSLDEEFEQLMRDRDGLRQFLRTESVVLPCNLERLVLNTQYIYKIDPLGKTTLSPLEVVDEVKQLCGELIVVRARDTLSRQTNHNASALLCCLIRSVLSSKRVIEKYRLTSDALHHLVGEIKTLFHKAIVNIGEMVGALAAESIGEPATQMTLNTFHLAGVSKKNVTLGVPRLKEIINIAKNPKTPSMSVYLTDQYGKDVAKAREIAARLEYANVRKLVDFSEIYFDPNPEETIVERDREWLGIYYDFPDFNEDKVMNYVLRIKLNEKKLESLKMDLYQIAEAICQYFDNDISCHVPDDNILPVMRIRVLKKSTEMEESTSAADHRQFLELIENTILNDVSLQGVPQISKVYLSNTRTQDDKYLEVNLANGAFKDKIEWMLETDGTCLQEVLAQPGVDQVRTITNHIVEIFEVFGIEAARQAIENELVKVLSFDGGYVNHRHVTLLCDVMSSQGYLMSIDRHGINRQETGALARCSFEETVDILMKAGMHAEVDPVAGVSESLMLGQLARVGTGCSDIHMDFSLCQEAQSLPNLGGGDCGGSSMFMTGGSTPLLGIDSPNISSWASSDSPYDGSLGSGTGSPFRAAFSPSLSEMGMSPCNAMGYLPLPGYSSPHTPDIYGLNLTAMTSPSSSSTLSSSISEGCAASSPGYSPSTTEMVSNSRHSQASPGYSPVSPGYSPVSPGYSPVSPGYSPVSPGYSPVSPGYSPVSPGYSPVSPGYSPASPGYSPVSPGYSAISPRLSLVKNAYNHMSSTHSPTSPDYCPTSPRLNITFNAYRPASPSFSPASPDYIPSSPRMNGTSNACRPGSLSLSTISPNHSSTSPQLCSTYSPASPSYSPTSPNYNPNSHKYSLISNVYRPPSIGYSHTSPRLSAVSNTYNPVSSTPCPNSTGYSPTSQPMSGASTTYSPASPTYSPTSPQMSAASTTYSPASPTYSPTSSQMSSASNTYSPASPTPFSNSTGYSPASAKLRGVSNTHSPASPSYPPTSPNFNSSLQRYSLISNAYRSSCLGYSLTTTRLSGPSNTYSPASPTPCPNSTGYFPGFSQLNGASNTYSPASPTYSPTSPQMNGASNTYSPASPTYSPQMDGASNTYSPASPTYSPTSPQMDGASNTYSPASPTYSPTSPQMSSTYSSAYPAKSTD